MDALQDKDDVCKIKEPEEENNFKLKEVKQDDVCKLGEVWTRCRERMTFARSRTKSASSRGWKRKTFASSRRWTCCRKRTTFANSRWQEKVDVRRLKEVTKG